MTNIKLPGVGQVRWYGPIGSPMLVRSGGRGTKASQKNLNPANKEWFLPTPAGIGLSPEE